MRSRTERRAAWLSFGSFICLSAVGCWSTSSGVAGRANSPAPMWRPPTSGQASVRPGLGPPSPSTLNNPAVATKGVNPPANTPAPLPTRPEGLGTNAPDRATLSQGAIAAVERGNNATAEPLPPPESSGSRELRPIATNASSSVGKSSQGVQPASHVTSGEKLPDLDPVPGSQPAAQPTDLPAVAPISYQDIPIKRNWQKSSPPVMPVDMDLPPPNPSPKLRGAEPAAPLSPPPQ